MRTLPNPAGPYLVGSATREIVDSSRASHLLSRDAGRRILVKCWYPASESARDTCRRERLWEQLRSEPSIPGFVKLVLRPAMKVMTNSYHDAPYATSLDPPRILIYSHGLISFASENSMLMEHLASHGYIVISLQHMDQLAEFQALRKAQQKDEKQEQARLQRKIKASSVLERAELCKEYFRIASNTNQIVSGRCLDVEYAVSQLGVIMEAIPGVHAASATELIGVIGLSLGGAVATEYARQNSGRVSCVVNLDGGIYGSQLEKPIDTPYLMLYSHENDGTNDSSLATTDGVEITRKVIPDTKHLNFHDIAAVYPVLKWLGAIGSASPIAVVKERNQSISDFVFDTPRQRRTSSCSGP
jgi:Platelet-activating factor acetylhydrolase, isoform II